ncbi:hypothetical protein, partial [Nostoc sp.]|uniref:hypothetical protein n=1 Tax=Nostoc sp. TaxID=1180 RepID=UPI002FF4B49E
RKGLPSATPFSPLKMIIIFISCIFYSLQVPKHSSRTTTMLKGKIVGDCDKLVTWYKQPRQELRKQLQTA